jgi:asparagine synthase (glutamine-hydrolysing)
MCGIAGIFSTSPEPAPMRAAAERMQHALHHRGPDDAGLWQSECGHAVLAHRRLSIIDLTSGAQQPMSSPDGRFTICFNGEIYNYRELRAELLGSGVTFSTSSDTEVILRLFERNGIECVQRLRGMFAFAIWDKQEMRGTLARDPFGIKPLYFTEQAGRFLFASELNALRASGLIQEKLDPRALSRYFETGSVAEPNTLIKGVSMLPPGSTVRWEGGRCEAAQIYWSPLFPPSAPRQDAAQTVRTALLNSVAAHFVSDVPVGLFLSGGIDSTALLALARVLGHENLRTFSIGVDDVGLDESSVAARTAKHFGTEHFEQRLNAQSGLALFDQFLSALDQPSIDGLNTFTVSALARQHGQKVVLSGLGGDEVFGGYPTFRAVPKLVRWGTIARRLILPRLASPLLERMSHPKLKRIGSYFAQQPSTSSAYARVMRRALSQLAMFMVPHMKTKSVNSS